MSQMLYKPGNQFKWEGLSLDSLIVAESEIEAKLSEGWFLSPFDAKQPEPIAPPEPKGPPTRAELEQKATELKIKFDGRTSDTKLAYLIEEALK